MTSREVTLKMTCEACPEQYDAYQGRELVGYLWLRWGHFKVRCPDVGGEVVYAARIGDDLTGAFTSDDEQEEHLGKAKAAIRDWLEKRAKVVKS